MDGASRLRARFATFSRSCFEVRTAKEKMERTSLTRVKVFENRLYGWVGHRCERLRQWILSGRQLPNVPKTTTRVRGSSQNRSDEEHSRRSFPKFSVVSCTLLQSWGDLLLKSPLGCQASAIVSASRWGSLTCHMETEMLTVAGMLRPSIKCLAVTARTSKLCWGSACTDRRPEKAYPESCFRNTAYLYGCVTMMDYWYLLRKRAKCHTDFENEMTPVIRNPHKGIPIGHSRDFPLGSEIPPGRRRRRFTQLRSSAMCIVNDRFGTIPRKTGFQKRLDCYPQKPWPSFPPFLLSGP